MLKYPIMTLCNVGFYKMLKETNLTFSWLPKLKVAGSNPVSRSKNIKGV
jgi:hypothetical protein